MYRARVLLCDLERDAHEHEVTVGYAQQLRQKRAADAHILKLRAHDYRERRRVAHLRLFAEAQQRVAALPMRISSPFSQTTALKFGVAAGTAFATASVNSMLSDASAGIVSRTPRILRISLSPRMSRSSNGLMKNSAENLRAPAKSAEAAQSRRYSEKLQKFAKSRNRNEDGENAEP